MSNPRIQENLQANFKNDAKKHKQQEETQITNNDMISLAFMEIHLQPTVNVVQSSILTCTLNYWMYRLGVKIQKRK